MRMIALLALLALPPAPALAQGSNAPQPAPPLSSQLPLAAMRHHQPREDTVREHQIEREGAEKVEQQDKQQQLELDQLYHEILQRSAASGRD